MDECGEYLGGTYFILLSETTGRTRTNNGAKPKTAKIHYIQYLQ